LDYSKLSIRRIARRGISCLEIISTSTGDQVVYLD